MSYREATETAPPVVVAMRGALHALDRVAHVTVRPGLPPVRVRFRFDDNGTPWRCDVCGRFRLPGCVHAQHVADALIRELLDRINFHDTLKEQP